MRTRLTKRFGHCQARVARHQLTRRRLDFGIACVQANSRVFGLIRSNFLPDSSGRCTVYWLPWSRREMCQSTLSRITVRRCRRASNSSSDGSSILLPADPIGFVFTGIPTMRFSGLVVAEAFLPISGSIPSPVPRLSLSVPAKCIGGTKSRALPDR